MYLKCLLTACLVATIVSARSTQNTQQNAIPDAVETPRGSSDITSYMGDIRFLYKVYQECSATDLSSCLKLKLVTAIDRVARSYSSVPLFDGVNFVKDPNTIDTSAPIKNEAELEASLPRSLADREDTLNGLIFEKIIDFFQSHTLQIKLPTATDLERSFNDAAEGRGKKKKMGGLLLVPLMIGGTLIPLAFGALALLAGKALIVSKLALVLAGIIGLKKLLSGSHGGHESGHVEVVAGGHGGGGWGRSFNKAEEAQNLAYRAHAAAQQNTQ
ncbi:uncharacterized protein LOC123305596 [Chrysoperla carnea]|uniref:uncharacterized protein LOC123305596 n=1 Tax=Chrysoperla carnea TaxID=189513 RepID=UPI001D06DA9A|nr:uncharacterized protein LOC123305596 [Chrysoperla carnea]